MSSSFVTSWAVAHQAPLSMGFPTLEWVAISFSRYCPNPRTKCCPLHWQADSLPLSHLGSPLYCYSLFLPMKLEQGSRDHTRSYSENSSVLLFSNASLITISVRKLWKIYCFQMATDMVIWNLFRSLNQPSLVAQVVKSLPAMWETQVQVSEAGKSQNNNPMKVDFESKHKLTW